MITGIEEHIFFNLILPILLWVIGSFSAYALRKYIYGKDVKITEYNYAREWVVITFCILTSWVGVAIIMFFGIKFLLKQNEE